MFQGPHGTYTMLVYTLLHVFYAAHILPLNHQDASPANITNKTTTTTKNITLHVHRRRANCYLISTECTSQFCNYHSTVHMFLKRVCFVLKLMFNDTMMTVQVYGTSQNSTLNALGHIYHPVNVHTAEFGIIMTVNFTLYFRFNLR